MPFPERPARTSPAPAERKRISTAATSAGRRAGLARLTLRAVRRTTGPTRPRRVIDTRRRSGGMRLRRRRLPARRRTTLRRRRLHLRGRRALPRRRALSGRRTGLWRNRLDLRRRTARPSLRLAALRRLRLWRGSARRPPVPTRIGRRIAPASLPARIRRRAITGIGITGVGITGISMPAGIALPAGAGRRPVAGTGRRRRRTIAGPPPARRARSRTGRRGPPARARTRRIILPAAILPPPRRALIIAAPVIGEVEADDGNAQYGEIVRHQNRLAAIDRRKVFAIDPAAIGPINHIAPGLVVETAGDFHGYAIRQNGDTGIGRIRPRPHIHIAGGEARSRLCRRRTQRQSQPYTERPKRLAHRIPPSDRTGRILPLRPTASARPRLAGM